MPLLSIISPVYNVEAYIEKGIESVLHQTIADFEFFLVDDGSTDSSGSICKKYARQDARIHYIRQENQGSSAARNYGLDHAAGKYIYFLDADDWIERDMLQKMVELAERHQADLIVTGFKMEYYLEGRNATFQTSCPDKIYNSINEFHHDAYHYLNNSLLSLPWNKLFLRQHIEEEHIRFAGTMWPDHHFCMDYLMNCKKVVLSSIVDYHWYRSRQGSATMLIYSNEKMFEKRLEHYQHILKVYDHWKIDDEESKDAINSYFIGRTVQCIQEMAGNKKIAIWERNKRITKIVNLPIVIEALKQAKTMTPMMKMMTIPLKSRNTGLCIVFGKCISLIRKMFPKLFIKLKEKEVHNA